MTQIYWTHEGGIGETSYCPLEEVNIGHYSFEGGGTTFSKIVSGSGKLEMLVAE
jgi:hypothetical protein